MPAMETKTIFGPDEILKVRVACSMCGGEVVVSVKGEWKGVLGECPHCREGWNWNGTLREFAFLRHVTRAPRLPQLQQCGTNGNYDLARRQGAGAQVRSLGSEQVAAAALQAGRGRNRTILRVGEASDYSLAHFVANCSNSS